MMNLPVRVPRPRRNVREERLDLRPPESSSVRTYPSDLTGSPPPGTATLGPG